MNMKDIYDEYVEDCKDKPVDYQEWLHSEFAELLNKNLSDYEKCLIYNEYADFKGMLMWDDIESLNDIEDNFLHLYSLISNSKFNEREDIIIEENFEIVSYTYEHFVDEYWNINDIVEYISERGVENIINSEIILDNV